MKERKKLAILTVFLFFIAVFYTILVKVVDVQAIGPGASKVGFATLNRAFHLFTGTNMFWYQLTKYLGIVPFFLVAFYGGIGIIQLLKSKSLKKVDRRLIFLGGFYILLGITYLFFEKVIINYRPVLLEEELEASYPSSHTMLAICICASSLLISKYYIKNPKAKKIFDILTSILLAILVIGRTLSGVHWFTDILGGILISLFLVSLYATFAYIPKTKKSR